MKKYYGVRFHGGNRTCTTGEPNEKTGKMSLAVSIEKFNTKTDLEKWLDAEDRCKPTGLGGGERMQINKNEIRQYCLGMSIENFNEYILMEDL